MDVGDRRQEGHDRATVIEQTTCLKLTELVCQPPGDIAQPIARAPDAFAWVTMELKSIASAGCRDRPRT